MKCEICNSDKGQERGAWGTFCDGCYKLFGYLALDQAAKDKEKEQ